MNTNIQASQSSPLNLLTTSDYPTKSQKALAIPSDHQDNPMRLPKDEAKYLIHHEQACSPSSTVYPEEGTDISDSVSALAVSRQSSACTTKKNKSAINSTQNPFSTVLGSGMVEEDNLHENETVKGEEKAFTDIPSRKSTADESALDEEEEDRSVEDEDSEEIKDWNEKKEKLLRSLAGKCKYDWKKIAKKFNTTEKTDIAPSILKQKYKGLVNAAIPLRVKFSHQEDLMIAKYFEQYGCDWVQIATHFTDRNAMMLKNRYYSHIRKRNLLDSMLEEVNGGVKREESQVKEEENMAEEDLSEESEAQNEENIAVEPVNIKVEAPVKIEEVHREKVYCEYEPFYGNREFLYRRIFNNIFDMENALRSELHHTIQMSYH